MFSFIICILGLTQLIAGSAFTFILGANEKSCFYVFTEKPKIPISFYFAVQSGGSFDVDYVITDPNGNKVMEDTKQRQGDFVFTADYTGEYEFCFSNTMSTFAEKLLILKSNLKMIMNKMVIVNLKLIYLINQVVNLRLMLKI